MNAKSSLCTISEDEIKWAQQNSLYKARQDYNEGMYRAEERGIQKASIANAKNLLRMNLGSLEQISQAVSLPLEQVLALKEELDREAVAVTM